MAGVCVQGKNIRQRLGGCVRPRDNRRQCTDGCMYPEEKKEK